MTGGQPHPGLPVDGMGWEAPEVSIDAIVEATGVKYLRKINPMNIKKSKETFMEALEFDGVAVVISQHPCMLTKGRRSSKAELEVKQEKCDECAVCLEKLACTAIYKDDEGKVRIDPKLCNGCNVCVQVCPERAIGVKK